ncbi:MAG: hypothetical protein ACRENI_08455 [Gemmatimonadaceae bacterium]
MLSLPALLTRLLNGPEVEGFPNLAAEQRSHVWRFLVRCAARALRSLKLPVDDATHPFRDTDIRNALLQSAPETAWRLYQPEPGKPGFLQPPTPSGANPWDDSYDRDSMSVLTSLIGSKSHERKADVAREATPEQAVYALIDYQGGAIYGGRGHYGSQLLGSVSGAGSGTPFMGARLGASNVLTFRHDVKVVLDRWDDTAKKLRGKVWAIWAEPWDGQQSLSASLLDPAFIPLARLVRLGEPSNGLFDTVWFRASKVARVTELMGGNLGDPYTPLVPVRDSREYAKKVRGTLRKGYDYTEVVALLFGEGSEASPSVEALSAVTGHFPQMLTVLFEGMAYEQGKTGGFHRREIVLPARYGRRRSEDIDQLRAAHGEMLQCVKEAKSALRGAFRIYLTGSPKPRESDASPVEAGLELLDADIDAVYLLRLFDAAKRRSENDNTWDTQWRTELSTLARESFERARRGLPSSVARFYQRSVDARSYLEWKLSELRGEEPGMRGSSDNSTSEGPQL